MICYESTRGEAPAVDFEDALFAGLAPDGGLYFPTEFPQFTADEIAALKGIELPEVAYRVLHKWLGDEIEAATLREIATAAQHFPIPIRKVGPFQVMELFHGPTQAFKDVAAQNLARLMSHFLQQRQETVTLLVATSGDTGGAIAHGFSNVPNIEVFVLFPKGRVSALQEEQLTRVADNVHPIEVTGVFDDCQAMVKRAFTDTDLVNLNLTSANSISIGRLLPQVIYYAYAYATLGSNDISFVVPSGNFGNLTAGLFARAMGLPFDEFVAATNVNDSVVRYYETAAYDPHETVRTMSNAMDVGNPSNFTRILELFDHDHRAFTEVMRAYRVDDGATAETIRRVHDGYGYMLDPHTAVGWQVAEQHGRPNRTNVVVATASPIKFAAEIEAATGLQLDNAAAIAELRRRPARRTAIPNDYQKLKDLLLAER